MPVSLIGTCAAMYLFGFSINNMTLLALTLSGSIIMPLSGVGFMGWKSGSYRVALTTLLLHSLWGLVVGIIYIPAR